MVKKKKTGIAETRATYGAGVNRTRFTTPGSPRPIRDGESDAEFLMRLRSVVGDNTSAFGRACGLKEATLRTYINDGRMPPLDNACKIADAGGVLIDWLATGRLPKTRAELKALQDAASRPTPVKINHKALATAMIARQNLAKPGETPETTALKAVQLYQHLLDQDLITPEGLGQGNLNKSG